MKHLARSVQFRSMVQRSRLKGTSLQTPFVATRFNASLSNENFKQFKHVILISLPIRTPTWIHRNWTTFDRCSICRFFKTAWENLSNLPSSGFWKWKTRVSYVGVSCGLQH